MYKLNSAEILRAPALGAVVTSAYFTQGNRI